MAAIAGAAVLRERFTISMFAGMLLNLGGAGAGAVKRVTRGGISALSPEFLATTDAPGLACASDSLGP